MAHQNPENIIQKVEEVTEKRSSAPMDFESFEPETRMAPNKEHFDNLMAPPNAVDTADVRKVHTAKNSIIDEVANVSRMAEHAQRTPKDLIAQAQEVVGKINQLKEKLNTPNLEINSSLQKDLRKKLSFIDDNLRVAMSRSGIEYTPPPPPQKSQTVIERFLGLLTDGQDKLQKLTTDIARVDASKEPYSPATLIVMHMKVNQVQQQIEFFSTALNKALEATKTVMNVQV